MKKINTAAIKKALKGKRAAILIMAAFVLIGLISFWSYKKSMTELLNDGIISGQNQNRSGVLADAEKEDVTEEQTTAEAQTATEVEHTMGYAMPHSGEIINGFSDGALWKSETLGYWLTHDGIDIATQDGDDILSAGEGIVEDIYDDVLWGTCVVINHQDGLVSYYFGLAPDLDVSEGDEVITGQRIGFASDTAAVESSEGCHLHFAVKQNGEWIDPQSIM